MTSPDLPLEAAAPARSPTVAKRAGWSALAIGFSVVGVVWGRRRLILSVLEI
ncbi:MAG: hypothetical protein GYB66_15960, partial [Chloroflexi bacterium]|nr:hypothetical protein [Chloroflexota bacterium]